MILYAYCRSCEWNGLLKNISRNAEYRTVDLHLFVDLGLKIIKTTIHTTGLKYFLSNSCLKNKIQSRI